MKRYIAFLRGINVGGHRKILMADLKSLFLKMGFSNVITYIQSGNIVFDTESSLNCKIAAELIQKEIKQEFGFDVPTIVLATEDYSNTISQNPFLKEYPIEKLFLTMLSENPKKELLEKVNSLSFLPDQFVIIGRYIFGYCEGKYHQTKISNQFFEKQLDVSATSRNWRTVLKMASLSSNKN